MHADFYLLVQLMFCILNSMDITLCEASVGQRGKGGICVLGNKRGPGSFLPKRTQVSACPTPISPKLILWVGGSCDMTKCKGHPLEVFCCGDIIGYFCDLFLGHCV